MFPIPSALLTLGLCLGQRIRTQADTLSRPSLRAENGPLVPRGKNVAFRCLALWSVDEYILGKVHEPNWRKIMDMKPSKREGTFHIPSVSENHAATYFCRYRHSSGWSRWSEPLKLVVTGLYPSPSLSALPSSMVASGQDVMFQCHSQGWYDSYALYKDGEEMMQGMAQRHKKGSQANSSISAVTFIHKGTYQCYSFRSQSPQEWSAPSKALLLRVIDSQTSSPRSQSWTNVFDESQEDSHGREDGGRGWMSSLSRLNAGILMGISAFLILLFLFFICNRYCLHQTRLRNKSSEGEVKKTTKSSKAAGTPLEETLYASVNDNRQKRPDKKTWLSPRKREETQEATYAQVNFKSLNPGTKKPRPSGLGEPSLYASLW